MDLSVGMNHSTFDGERKRKKALIIQENQITFQYQKA